MEKKKFISNAKNETIIVPKIAISEWSSLLLFLNRNLQKILPERNKNIFVNMIFPKMSIYFICTP